MGQSLAYNLWRETEKETALKAYKTIGASTIAIIEKDPTVINRISFVKIKLFANIYFRFSII